MIRSLWVAMALALFMPLVQASDQYDFGHPPEHMAIHEMFYKDWLRPDPAMRTGAGDRQYSCCNNQDCAPVDGVEVRDGEVWMLRHSDQRWLLVPKEKLEHNYPDARESPDGRAHMCSTGVTVYCAVLGAAY